MRTSTRQDWLAAAAIIAGLVGAYTVTPATTGASAARAVASLTIGALIALAVARSPFTFAPRIRTGFVLLTMLALWYVTTRAWAVDPAGSMVESSRVSAFVLLAWASHTSVVGTWARRALLAAIAGVALYVSWPLVVNLAQHGAPSVRIVGRLGYWNATAVVALTLVPLAVALAGTARVRYVALASVLIPVAGIAAVATASRGALLGLLVALFVQALLEPDHRGGLPRAGVATIALVLVVVGLSIHDLPEWIALGASVCTAGAGFGVLRARRTHAQHEHTPVTPVCSAAQAPLAPASSIGRHQPPRLTRRAGSGIVAGVVLVLVALVVTANHDQVRLGDAPPASSQAVPSERLLSTDDSLRFDWWQRGIEVWRRSPIIGEGGGAFALERFDADHPSPGHVHSMPLEVLLEAGLIGFVLLMAAAVQFLRVLRHGRRTPDRAAAGAIAALLVTQSLVDWTLSFPQVLAVLAICAPLAVQAPPDPTDDAARTQQPLPAWGAIAMLTSLAVATVVALVPMLATMLADQGARRIDEGEPVQAVTLLNQSMQLVPSLETLSLQVLALQAAGRNDDARALLRSRQQVWLTTQDGLQLAQDLLANDPVYGPRIRHKLAQYEHGSTTT